jgi:plasmid stabilization system protein ParE
MKVVILPAAQDDLSAIDSWVLENFGVSFADRTLAQLYNTFERMVEFPQMGSARPDIDTRSVRYFLLKPYWIVYQPGTPLLIHRVYHSARDLARLNRP